MSSGKHESLNTHGNPSCPDEPSILLGMDNIVGLIDDEEIGFAYRIDRKYKDKSDDVSSLFYVFEGNEEEFREFCKELNIQVLKI